jgi:hypothetical protein
MKLVVYLPGAEGGQQVTPDVFWKLAGVDADVGDGRHADVVVHSPTQDKLRFRTRLLTGGKIRRWTLNFGSIKPFARYGLTITGKIYELTV